MHAPQTISSPPRAGFAALGLPAPVVDALAALGVREPFPIQSEAIPAVLAGRDVCGQAPTGSGKTVAFGAPLVVSIGSARHHRPTGLVLVPTRELAEQVRGQLEPLARAAGRRVVAVYGGAAAGPQVKALRQAVDIVVSTPGRLMDLIRTKACDLSEVEMVVVDEADRMADMGFLPDVRRLLDMTPPTRRTMLFSATPEGDVGKLVAGYQNNAVRFEVGAAETDAADVSHAFEEVAGPERAARAAQLVAKHGRTIVFCRTKRGADRVAKQLASYGVKAAAIHGDRSQSQRQRALDDFSRGRVDALVATDVAARGIHVDDVACVIQLDLPATATDYVHRSGRTGRAGATGHVVSLVPPAQRGDAARLRRQLDLPATSGHHRRRRRRRPVPALAQRAVPARQAGSVPARAAVASAALALQLG